MNRERERARQGDREYDHEREYEVGKEKRVNGLTSMVDGCWYYLQVGVSPFITSWCLGYAAPLPNQQN